MKRAVLVGSRDETIVFAGWTHGYYIDIWSPKCILIEHSMDFIIAPSPCGKFIVCWRWIDTNGCTL